MIEHEPGRELDVMVHRALEPSHILRNVGNEELYWEPANFGRGVPVPAYSTSLMAWDWSREGWSWYTQEHMSRTIVVWRQGIGCFASVFQQGVLVEQEPNRFRAQAYARSLCVLQWAERVEASDG